LTVLTFSLTFRPRQPYKLVLTAEAIRFRYPLSPWRSWPAGQLQEIELRSKTVRGVRSQGGRYIPTTISKPEVVLRFSEERVLNFSVERARQFGLTPPVLYALLQSLYEETVG
jgi:hypothetical protein